MRTKVALEIAVFVIVMAVGTGARAAEHYVSTAGDDLTGDGSIGRPWRTPEYGATRLSNGDTLYIRQGTYNVATRSSPFMHAAVFPGGNDCTIRSYPGETVVLQGNGGIPPTNGVIGNWNGSVGRNNLTIDGLTIRGIVVLGWGTTGGVVQNCDISVGVDSWTGTEQGEVIWIQGATNVKVRNNKLHDNSKGAGAAELGGNNGLIMVYNAKDLLVENNEFFRSYGTAMTMKDDLENAIIRFNYFHDNGLSALLFGTNPTVAFDRSASVYQNAFVNNNTKDDMEHGAICFHIRMSLVEIYNNTFYQNYQGDIVQWVGETDAVPFTFFNNISSLPRKRHLSWPYSASYFSARYLDYNQYEGDVEWKYRASVFGSFGTWAAFVQANLLQGAEAHSVVKAANFLNASGSWNTPSDFKRAVYPLDGRGGLYPAVIGAFITGNETIGVLGTPAGGRAPASPTGVTIRVQ